MCVLCYGVVSVWLRLPTTLTRLTTYLLHSTAILHPSFIQVIVHLVLNTAVCFVVITTLYVRTLAVYVRRYGFKRTGQQWQPEQEPQQQPLKSHKQRQHAALWRLVLLLTCFKTVWLIVIANDFRTMRHGGGREFGMGDAPSTFMVSTRRGRDSAARKGRLSFIS